MLQTAKDNEEKLNACNTLWTLAFDGENKKEIKSNELAITELKKLLTGESSEIQRAAGGALWESTGKDKHAEEKKQAVKLEQVSGTHVLCLFPKACLHRRFLSRNAMQSLSR